MTFPRLHSGDDVQRCAEIGCRTTNSPIQHIQDTQGAGVTTRSFSRSELSAAFEKFEETVARAAETRDWEAWVAQYTPDVEYVEHAAGTMRGRDQVREWIQRTMTTFPGRDRKSVV